MIANETEGSSSQDTDSFSDDDDLDSFFENYNDDSDTDTDSIDDGEEDDGDDDDDDDDDSEGTLEETEIAYAEWLVERGSEHYDKNRLQEAKECLQAAFATYRAHFYGFSAATCQEYIGSILSQQGKLNQALDRLHWARITYEAAETVSQRVASICIDIGDVLRRKGSDRIWEAETYLRRAVHILEQEAPESRDLTCAYNHLAKILADQGKLLEAWDCYKKDQQITERIAPDSLDLAATLCDMGGNLKARGDLVDAMEYQKQAFAIRERLAPRATDVTTSLYCYGQVLFLQGDWKKALNYFAKALANEERLGKGESFAMACIYSGIAGSYEVHGRLEQSLVVLHECSSIVERLRGPESTDFGVCLRYLGDVQEELGRKEEAMRCFERSQAIIEKAAPRSDRFAVTLHAKANAHRDRCALGESILLYTRARSIMDAVAPDSVTMARLLKDMALAVCMQGDYMEALRLTQRACDLLQEPRVGMVPSHPLYVQGKMIECFIHTSLGNLDAAVRCANDILDRLPESKWARLLRGDTLASDDAVVMLLSEAAGGKHKWDLMLIECTGGTKQLRARDLDRDFRIESIHLHNRLLVSLRDEETTV